MSSRIFYSETRKSFQQYLFKRDVIFIYRDLIFLFLSFLGFTTNCRFVRLYYQLTNDYMNYVHISGRHNYTHLRGGIPVYMYMK